MSKHRPPHAPATPSIGQVTADSPLTAILREEVKVRMEIIRRQDYQDLLALRARLAELPPVPASHAPPANED